MSKEQILVQLQNKEISVDEASKLLAQYEGKGPTSKLYPKVSEKGAISVYGLQRMPVTLYVEQWQRLLDPEFVKEMTAFMAANKSKLTLKADKKAAA